jgi:hypothetical protein
MLCTPGMKTTPGRYYARTTDDLLITVDAPGRAPDVVICRRVVDYPSGHPPVEAAITTCRDCGVPVAFNPRGPHQERPRICLQCAGIHPLPMDS